MPIAHGEGCYFADEKTLRELNERRQIILRYSTPEGRIEASANPNGSLGNIAGVTLEAIEKEGRLVRKCWKTQP